MSGDLRTRGLGQRIVERFEERYRASGADYSTLNAALTGAYFWAERGYHFDPRVESKTSCLAEGQMPRALAAMTKDLLENRGYLVEQLVAENKIPPSLANQYFSSDTALLSAPQLAVLGREVSWEENRKAYLIGKNRGEETLYLPVEMWLGKAILIDQMWSGIKDLSD